MRQPGVLALCALLVACGGESPSSLDGGAPSEDGGTGADGGELNRAPVWGPLDPLTVTEGATSKVTLSATDPDGDAVELSLLSAPPFVSLSGATLTVSPGYSAAGAYTLTLSAYDGEATTNGTLQVTVLNSNRAPVLAPLSDLTMPANATQAVALSATDPDGDALTYSLGSGTPSWITVAGETLTLTAPASAASVPVTVTVSDGQSPPLTDSKSFTVTVRLTTVVGSISIENGATYATASTVSLTLSATSQGGTVQQMRFSSDATSWTAWESYATSKAYTLTGQGTKTVYVEFRDSSSVVARFSDTIIVDTVKPVATLNVGNGRTATNQTSVSLSITPSETPVEQAITVVAGSAATPTSPGTFEAFMSPKTVSLGTVEGGKKICVWLRDPAGNVSAAPTVYNIAYDITPPTVSSIVPAADSTGVARDVRPVISFSDLMDPTTINATNVSIAGVTATTSYFSDPGVGRALVTPSALLAANTQYTLNVTGVKDAAGNTLAGTFTSRFTTGDFRPISAPSAPFQTFLSTSTGSETLVVSKANSGGNYNEVRAYFHDGAGWSGTSLSEGTEPQLAQFTGKFAVSWRNPGKADGMSVLSNGQWTHDLPVPYPYGTLVGAPTGLFTISPFSEGSSPFYFDVWSFNGSGWVKTGGSATDVVVSTVGHDTNDSGMAIVYGKLISAGNYGVYVNRFDGSTWTTATLGGGSGFPGSFRVAGSGNSFLACWTAGVTASGCNVFDPSTGTWGTKARPAGLTEIVGNGTGFALGSLSGSTVTVEASSGLTWPGGSAILSAPGTSGLKVTRRPGGYVAVWWNGTNLQTSAFDGAAWSAVTTLVSGPSLVFGSSQTVGTTTVVTWHDTLNAYARAFDGTSWTASTTLNTAELAGQPLAGAFGVTPAVYFPEGNEVRVRSFQTASKIFQPAQSAGSTTLSGNAAFPNVAFDGSGKGLAVWEQFDGGRQGVVGAYFDGMSWGAPFRVALVGRSPKVAYRAGSFLVAYVVYTQGATTNAVRSVRYSPGSGLGAAVDVASLPGNTAVVLAAGSTGFMAAWAAEGVVSAVSSDGASWSTPTTVESTARDYLGLAPVGAGFVISSYSWTNYQSSLRYWNGTAWVLPTTASGTCKVVGNASLGAAICHSTNYSVAVFNLTSWTSLNLGPANGENAIAASSSGLRVMYANSTRTYSGTWSTPVSVSPAGASAMVSDGTEYFALGGVQAGSTINLNGYRSTSGTMSSFGLVEHSDGFVPFCAAAFSGTGFVALWTQHELPSERGSTLVYARSY